MSAAAIEAVTWVALTNEVDRLLPFHCTVEDETKPLPLTVNVNASAPAVIAAGEREATVGVGLGEGEPPPPPPQPDSMIAARAKITFSVRGPFLRQ